jgi:hypothetical protein
VPLKGYTCFDTDQCLGPGGGFRVDGAVVVILKCESGPQMKSLLSSMAILWLAVSGVSASAATVKAKADVSVVQNVPADASFVWETAGDDSTMCAGADCLTYVTLDDQIHGMPPSVLKLQFPDGKIVVAECAGAAHCTTAGGARMVRAELDGAAEDQVKVFAAPQVVAGKVKMASATYQVRGVLRPHLHVELGAVLTASGVVSGPMSGAAAVAEAAEVSAGNAAAAQSDDKGGRCLVAAEPADALIYVDGQLVGTSPTEMDWDGTAGAQHTVTVQKAGWASSEQTITMGDRGAAISVRLLPTDTALVAAN